MRPNGRVSQSEASMADVEYGSFGGDASPAPRVRPGAMAEAYRRARVDGAGAAAAAQPRSARGTTTDAGPPAGLTQRVVNGAGALTSVVLVLGLAVWGYRLAVRDVTGVPVIRALEGPARSAPADPGGDLAAHQGLAVNAVTADGTAAPPADRLVLAPRPVDLAEADGTMGAMAVEGAAASAAAPDPSDPVLASLDPASLTLPSLALTTTSDAGADLSSFVAPDVISADIPGVSRSLRPPMRPSGDPMAEAAAAAVAEALAPAAALDVDPATLETGTRLVQLGTYDSEDAARADWDRILATFGPLMDGKRRVVEPATSNGGTFFRLRAEGFADIADARRFCSVLEDQNATCVPALVR